MLIRIFVPWIALAAILGIAIGGSLVWSSQEPEPYDQRDPAKAQDQYASPSGANVSKGHADKHVGKRQQEGDWYDTFFDHMPDWFVAAFTGILSAITFLLVRSTNRLWDAGERQLKLATDTAQRQLRAYLYVMSNATPEFDGDGTLEGRFLLKNAGQTPALKVRTVNGMSIGRLPFEGDPPAIGEHLFEGGSVLAPGATIRLICRIPEPPPQRWRQALKDKTHAVCMYGEIRYQDIFGEEHVTTYRAMYGGPVTEGVDEILWTREGNHIT